MSVSACLSTDRRWAQAQESVRTGREVEVAGGGGVRGGQRDDEEGGEEMGSFLRRMHPSANQPWAPPRKGAMGGATWGVENSLRSQMGPTYRPKMIT